jgi:hypothetical protein
MASNAAPRSLERLLDFHSDLGVVLTSFAQHLAGVAKGGGVILESSPTGFDPDL